MNEQMVREIEQILGPGFEVDYFSRLKGYAVFHADRLLVDEDDLRHLTAQLMARGYYPRIDTRDGYWILHVVPYKPEKVGSPLWLHGILFLLTIITTMMAGATLLGKDYFSDLTLILHGWKYSFAVLTILTAHEFGHYIAARIHKIRATLPYYIPLPIPGFHFGTLGAFIKIKSPIPTRTALLDVGAAGPLAGFVMSLIFLGIGYWRLPDFQGIVAYVETIHPWNIHGEGINLVLGKSLLFAFFNDVLAGGRLPMNEVYHFPFIFAGWVGLLVTAINLIPIGQLDGGHILYALLQNRARFMGILAFILLILLNLVLIVRFFSFVWVVWIFLILFLIGFRHPPTVEDDLPVDPLRRRIGWFTLFIFVLCFTPLPVYIA